MKHWRKASNLQEFAKTHHYGKESLLEDGSGDRTPACRQYTHPRADSDSRIYAAIPGQTIIGPVLQIHIIQFLGTHGIDYWKDMLHKKTNLVIQRWSNLASRKTHATKFRRIQCTVQDKLFLLSKRSGMTFLPTNISKEITPRAEISKLVMRLVRRYDQDERETDGAVQEFDGSKTSKSISEGRRAQILGLRLASTHFMKEVTRRGSSIAWIPKNLVVFSCHSRTHWWEYDSARVDGSPRYSIQMERILVSSRMLFWCHFNPQIRTHRWRTRKQGRKTHHLLHTPQPFRGQSRRRRTQRWPLKAEKKCTITVSGQTVRTPSTVSIWLEHKTIWQRFWQTRSHAVIVHSSVAADFASTKWFLAKDFWECVFWHQKLVQREEQGNPTDKGAEYWVTCWERRAWI